MGDEPQFKIHPFDLTGKRAELEKIAHRLLMDLFSSMGKASIHTLKQALVGCEIKHSKK